MTVTELLKQISLEIERVEKVYLYYKASNHPEFIPKNTSAKIDSNCFMYLFTYNTYSPIRNEKLLKEDKFIDLIVFKLLLNELGFGTADALDKHFIEGYLKRLRKLEYIIDVYMNEGYHVGKNRMFIRNEDVLFILQFMSLDRSHKIPKHMIYVQKLLSTSLKGYNIMPDNYKAAPLKVTVNSFIEDNERNMPTSLLNKLTLNKLNETYKRGRETLIANNTH